MKTAGTEPTRGRKAGNVAQNGLVRATSEKERCVGGAEGEEPADVETFIIPRRKEEEVASAAELVGVGPGLEMTARSAKAEPDKADDAPSICGATASESIWELESARPQEADEPKAEEEAPERSSDDKELELIETTTR